MEVLGSIPCYLSLNPYYNGKYSYSMRHKSLPYEKGRFHVLILIIMENTL